MTKCRDEIEDRATRRLLVTLPKEQADRVFASPECDIDPEFLGFVGVYDQLAAIIPEHWTVVDLGCAYSPQAFFFRRHKAYVGVDLSVKDRFAAENTRHLTMSISEFVNKHACEFDQSTTFAICSYVPSWGADNGALARAAFKNVFVFYPSGPSIKLARPAPRQAIGEG